MLHIDDVTYLVPQRMSIHNNILFMALRMTFGGSPCPALWGYISEIMVDICNIIIHNEYWNPNTLFDPILHTLPPPTSLPDDVPFYQAKELAVQILDDDAGKTDIYLNDTIRIAPDINNNVQKVCYAIPLAIHTLSRPTHDGNLIPRKDIILV